MSKATAIIAEFYVCSDCAQVLANGTDGWGLDDDGRELGELHAARMRDGDIVLAGPADDDDPDDDRACLDFAHGRCDTCGTTDAGHRCVAVEFGQAVPTHADYPHHPGYLVGCDACEASCHCDGASASCVWPGHEDEDQDDSPAVSIPRGTRHLSGDAAWSELHACEGVREISDGCAATVAAWFAAARGPGEAFTRLVSHFPVTVAELHDAIAYERTMLPGYASGPGSDRLALDKLATWAMNGPDAYA